MLETYICTNKSRDAKGNITGYYIADTLYKRVVFMTPENIKEAIKNNSIVVENLKLTSNNRLISTNIDTRKRANVPDNILKRIKIPCESLGFKFAESRIKNINGKITFKSHSKIIMNTESHLVVEITDSSYILTLKIGDIEIKNPNLSPSEQLITLSTINIALDKESKYYKSNPQEFLRAIKLLSKYSKGILREENYANLIIAFSKRLGIYIDVCKYLQNTVLVLIHDKQFMERIRNICDGIKSYDDIAAEPFKITENSIIRYIASHPGSSIETITASDIAIFNRSDMMEYSCNSKTLKSEKIPDGTEIFHILHKKYKADLHEVNIKIAAINDFSVYENIKLKCSVMNQLFVDHTLDKSGIHIIYYCGNIDIVAKTDRIIMPENCSCMFSCLGAPYRVHIKDLSFDNVIMGKMKDLSKMFGYCDLTDLDLSNFDTHSVEYLYAIFYNCILVNTNISNWNTSKVTSMASSFEDCKCERLDLSHWDTSRVKSLNHAFHGSTLHKVNLSNWDVESLNEMTLTFAGSKLTSVNLDGWKMGYVKYLNRIFENCYIDENTKISDVLKQYI